MLVMLSLISAWKPKSIMDSTRNSFSFCCICAY